MVFKMKEFSGFKSALKQKDVAEPGAPEVPVSEGPCDEPEGGCPKGQEWVDCECVDAWKKTTDPGELAPQPE